MTFIFTVFGVALCVWSLSQPKLSWARLGVAAIGAAIAALSSLGGTAAFIAFLPPVLRGGIRKTLVWLAVAVGLLVPYFHGFPYTVSFKPSLLLVKFALVYLSAPTGVHSVTPAVYIAVGSMIYAVASVGFFWYTHRNFQGLEVWIGLGLFALAAATMTAIGRVAITDLPYALESRYQAFSALWWITLIALAAITITDTLHVVRTRIATRSHIVQLSAFVTNAAGLIVLTMVLILANQANVMNMEFVNYARLQNQQCILHYETATPVCLEMFYPNARRVQLRAAFLEQVHLGIFYEYGATRYPAPSPKVVPLTQYTNQSTGAKWVTTNYDVDLGTGYIAELTLGYVFVHAGPNTVAIYGCLSSTQDHFISLDPKCGEQMVEGVEGWIDSQSPADVAVAPLYQCSVGSHMSVGTDPHCSGSLLGYVLVKP